MQPSNDNPPISGIHHITAVAASAADNYRFYTRVLELRLVKKTVNFDDPFTYHLYYYKEPGGVLFEIATDPPGFTVDEDLHDLGTALKLPARYEALRGQIERQLPPLDAPDLAACAESVLQLRQ